jgi:hypothetical protein
VILAVRKINVVFSDTFDIQERSVRRKSEEVLCGGGPYSVTRMSNTCSKRTQVIRWRNFEERKKLLQCLLPVKITASFSSIRF